jgi:hypothetical protein
MGAFFPAAFVLGVIPGAQNEEAPRGYRGASLKRTLAQTYSPAENARSTMGAMSLNFCVRDGNRCDPHARCTKENF